MAVDVVVGSSSILFMLSKTLSALETVRSAGLHYNDSYCKEMHINKKNNKGYNFLFDFLLAATKYNIALQLFKTPTLATNKKY